jgi:hypothetical protein
MVGLILLIMLGLQFKHFLADYCFQTPLMIEGKGSIRAPGGYLHAGLHAVLTLVVLLVTGIALTLALPIILAEFVIHYLIDFAKFRISDAIPTGPQQKLYWIFHGGDQFLHHLTYLGIAYTLWTAAGQV